MIWLVIPVAAAGLIAWFLWEKRHRTTHAMPGGIDLSVTLPHRAEFELYHNALSLCSKKARVCLAELGIDYTDHQIDLIETGSYENISRRFLRVNPAGLVPVLVHNGHPIYESHEIIAYAAAHAPRPNTLVPATPDQQREMQAWVDRASLTGDDPTRAMRESAGNCIPGLTVPLFSAMIRFIPYHRIVEGLLFHRLKTRPLAFLAMKAAGLRRLGRLGPAAQLVRKSRAALGAHFDELEQQLAGSGGPWILGAQYTLADVSWVVIFDRLREADWLDYFFGFGRWPLTAAYWQRLQARPSYAAAIAAFAHPTVTRGTAVLQETKASCPDLRMVLEDA